MYNTALVLAPWTYSSRSSRFFPTNLPDSTFTTKKKECPSIPEEFNQEEVNQENQENDIGFDNTEILPDKNTGLVVDNNKINAETVDHSDGKLNHVHLLTFMLLSTNWYIAYT
ncbi:uncharacterized protein LOC130655229 [Hydractinia symbiolongicarpus]|uniref:uncharacterized protein LOC130655229 n=1 Tax=Hydractinia symbiolongicarpus TaxID=13093 RepID=UPI0025514261|nr:uncharacterized protein LOC130655229 [Hydractinia symbiolongicarpus]